MLAILTAKWVADALSSEGVYDLAQTVLGHPFLAADHAMQLVQSQSSAHQVRELLPPKQTMNEITVQVDKDNKVPRSLLQHKLNQLYARGLMDAGLVIVQHEMLQGYLAQGELEFGLSELGQVYASNARVCLFVEKVDGAEQYAEYYDEEQQRVVKNLGDGDMDLSSFVDRTPLSVCEAAPMEYAVELFGKLGLRHLMITEEGTGKLVGVIIKKRLVAYLESLH